MAAEEPRGEASDFETYARARQQQLYRTAFLLCGNADRAQDLTQTTLAKLFQYWRKASRATNIDAYAKTVLTRTFLAEQRSSRRERELHTPITPPVGPDRPDLRVTLVEALAALSPKARAMVVLRYWEDQPIEAVAASMNCRPGTVKSTCTRALRQLRELLGEDADLYATEG
ncbi:SigE family RNA polymerase sigma factor [Yinghuangia seranimata]|uniref:SigE family RNA polymerase sigma factor n=1 Tax=Yinghuangia seranimata TaxID=408067 RepID=UPI00248ADBA6|nr:SigE family RNA polymerase sigma factor [Yinghuangia seranimata]MDI2128851.1 SigE family RNA polymerase sigma factor [Yinghuangia seranimata]